MESERSYVVTHVIPEGPGHSEITMYVTIPGRIDRRQARIDRQAVLASIRKSLRRVEANLANENFLDRAPPEVVQRERDRLAALEREHEQVLIAHGNLTSED